MSPIDPGLSVLRLGKCHPVFRFYAACVMSFMQPKGEPRGRGGGQKSARGQKSAMGQKWARSRARSRPEVGHALKAGGLG